MIGRFVSPVADAEPAAKLPTSNASGKQVFNLRSVLNLLRL
jgi:hypothetical protein